MSEQDTQVVDTSVQQEGGEVSVETLQAELEAAKEAAAKAEEKYNNQKIRAEKAEKAPKAEEAAEETTAKEQKALSNQDLIAVSRSKLHDEDIDYAMNYAEKFDMPLYQVLKDKHFLAAVKVNEDDRKAAAASNTGAGRSGRAPATGDDYLNKMRSENVVPESDEGLRAMFAAEHERDTRKS